MNKKLIKQLKGVGFISKVSGGIRISLEVKGGYAFDYYEGDDRIHFYKDNETVATSIESPMFAQIVAKVKDITGVDLAKKTKREEIEELKKRVEALEQGNQSQAQTIEDMQGAIKSQNGLIELNKKEAHRANDRLTMVLRRLKVLGVWKDEEVKEKKNFGFVKIDNQGSWKGSRIEVVTETNFGATVKLVHYDMGETRFFKFNELSLDREPVKQEAEEKKAFEVGDRVCVTDDYEDARKGSVGVIDFPIFGTFYSDNEYYIGFNGMATWVHEDNLERAPTESPKEKALEFGMLAKTVGSNDLDDGTTVLLTRYVAPNWECRTDAFHNGVFHIQPKHLKPL